ncbi:hypothetical protein, partial [Escherichia coli]|uniref:hypothetical protein n=1 Tax=Escherichia coli TaxID=562 RepID=UPI0028808B0B
FCGACGNNRTNRGGFQFAAARLPWFAELKRSFLDPALKQINEKTPLLAKYSIDDSGKFLFSIIDKQNPV